MVTQTSLAALDDAREQVKRAGENATSDQLRTYLKLVRDLRARESRAVALAGSLLIRRHRSSLPEAEAWTVLEQAAAAAIDCGAPLAAAPAVAAVRERFPDSRRADALAALFLEATKRYEDAEEILDAACEEAPAEAGVLSARRAALAWGQGDAAEALRLMFEEHLNVFQADAEGWAQAGDWLVASGGGDGNDVAAAAARAAFCYEEALLHGPTSAASHARAADAFFTSADCSSSSGSNSSRSAGALDAARKHYGAAVALAGGAGCARALWGLVACEAAAVSSSSSKGGGARSDNNEGNAAELAALALLKKYAEEAPEKVSLAKAALEGLGGLKRK